MTRNETIAALYKQGKTQLELATMFSITMQRVGQILHAKGLSRVDRPKVSPFKREAFTGILLQKSVKMALKEVADSEHKSISLLISEILVAELKKRGKEIIENFSEAV